MTPDQLAELLTMATMPVARATPRQPTDAATPEQIDLIIALRQLVQNLQDFTERAPVQRPDSDVWAWLADVLGEAARLCREQVVIEGGDQVSARGPTARP